ncbi:GDSL-type esterase/lipase family protein [Spirosoma jeollabukense]
MNFRIVWLLLLTINFSFGQTKVIRLYDKQAPGSETWNWTEQADDSQIVNTKIAYNVVEPTLTVFPAQGINTGTAVIIAPGGALAFLSINSEGNEVAQWLSKKGVTAFVLKYRVAHTIDPIKALATVASSPSKFDSLVSPIIPLAMNDGLSAVAYVRKNAAMYDINPNRIGFMGFSAGGGVTMSVAYNANAESRPDFIAPIYAWDKNIVGSKAPSHQMPAFIAVASDDELKLTPTSLDIYTKWITAKQLASLHIYQSGGHGFGMKKQDKPSDSWIDQFGEWLGANGLLWPEQPTGLLKGVTYGMYKKYLQDQEEAQRMDWANRKRYAGDNALVAPLKPGEQRVVFMGNSITEGWLRTDSSFFNGKPYINRGISGQTTPQMLVRFREDVIALTPKVVVILAGINDIAENTGPISLESVLGNIVSMAELAKANQIKVVLASVLPAYDFPWRPGLQPAEKVVKLNTLLKAYATKNKLVYVDYYTPMVDDRKGLKAAYTLDGVHPTLPGYKVMEPLVEKAIAEALKR